MRIKGRENVEIIHLNRFVEEYVIEDLPRISENFISSKQSALEFVFPTLQESRRIFLWKHLKLERVCVLPFSPLLLFYNFPLETPQTRTSLVSNYIHFSFVERCSKALPFSSVGFPFSSSLFLCFSPCVNPSCFPASLRLLLRSRTTGQSGFSGFFRWRPRFLHGGDDDGGQSDLEYDFYRETCPEIETIVRSTMAQIYSHQKNVSAQLLRLIFHDCFIQRDPFQQF
nr:uncharacterized protein LOC103437624 [Malus domestica]